MTNRREFLKIGLAAAAWPGVTAADASPLHEVAEAPSLYKAIYDKAYDSAREFAAEMRRRGVVVHAIDQDITSVWFHDLALRWRRGPAAIAGLTAPTALFCLEQLAWDHRMRVVLQIDHRPGRNGAVEHEIRAPQAIWRRAEASLRERQDWGAATAELACCRPGPTSVARGRIIATHGAQVQDLPLVSWVIAPIDRT